MRSSWSSSSVSSRASIALTSENIRPIYGTRKRQSYEIDTSLSASVGGPSRVAATGAPVQSTPRAGDGRRSTRSARACRRRTSHTQRPCIRGAARSRGGRCSEASPAAPRQPRGSRGTPRDRRPHRGRVATLRRCLHRGTSGILASSSSSSSASCAVADHRVAGACDGARAPRVRQNVQRRPSSVCAVGFIATTSPPPCGRTPSAAASSITAANPARLPATQRKTAAHQCARSPTSTG